MSLWIISLAGWHGGKRVRLPGHPASFARQAAIAEGARARRPRHRDFRFAWRANESYVLHTLCEGGEDDEVFEIFRDVLWGGEAAAAAAGQSMAILLICG